MNDTTGHYTTAQLIDKYIELRDYVQTKQKEMEEHLKIYKTGMANIEALMLTRLNAEGQQSAKAASGAIAFKQLHTYVKVADREKWEAFLATRFDEVKHMLTTHVSKDAVKKFVEQGNTIPDGVEMTQIWGVNFRNG